MMSVMDEQVDDSEFNMIGAQNSENNTSMDQMIPHGAILKDKFISKASYEDISTANNTDNVLKRVFLHGLHQDEPNSNASPLLAELPCKYIVNVTVYEMLKINGLENDTTYLIHLQKFFTVLQINNHRGYEIGLCRKMLI